MSDEKMIYGGRNEGMQNVSIFFSIPDEGQVEEGELPCFGVTVADNACPHFADALAVFETEVTDKESAEITAEWLESLAEKLREKWAHNARLTGAEPEGGASELTQMLGMEIDMSEERSAGMYEVSDPTYQQVKVGKYTICRQDEKSVWIQTDDGEGGQFSDEAFFAAVDAFYRANF